MKFPMNVERRKPGAARLLLLLPNEQRARNAPIQSHEARGVLPGQFNQVSIRDRLRTLDERRQLSHAEVVRN
jgi:hypothetical protein